MYKDQPTSDEEAIWHGVPATKPEVNFIVDEPQGNEMTVVTDTEVAGYDVIDLIYMIDGVWRIELDQTEDQDSNADNPGLILNLTLDRRYKPNDVRQAVSALLENLYRLDK